MPCTNPQIVLYTPDMRAAGMPVKYVGNRDKDTRLRPYEFYSRCRKCMDCRISHNRNTAIRIVNEASLYDNNCFVTLTYNDKYLPKNNSIDYKAPSDWMKRLRKKYEPTTIRSYGCAEYGDLNGRPHYHIILFNHNFTDLTRLPRKTRKGNILYRSKELEQLWPFGYSSVGTVTPDSASYVARYIRKKFTSKDEELVRSHYEWIDPQTGEIFDRNPEKPICVSKRPGIGAPWLEKFGKQTYERDAVSFKQTNWTPPSYYDIVWARTHPEEILEVKAKRKRASAENGHPDWQELRSREIILNQQHNDILLSKGKLK